MYNQRKHPFLLGILTHSGYILLCRSRDSSVQSVAKLHQHYKERKLFPLLSGFYKEGSEFLID